MDQKSKSQKANKWIKIKQKLSQTFSTLQKLVFDHESTVGSTIKKMDENPLKNGPKSIWRISQQTRFSTIKNALGFLWFGLLCGQGGRFLTDAISGWRPASWPLRGRPHGLFGGRSIIVSHGSFEARLLDFFGQPGDPDLLFLGRGRHQQHVFGRGGVVAHLAGWDALGYTIFVELCPETKNDVKLDVFQLFSNTWLTGIVYTLTRVGVWRAPTGA